MLQYHSVPTTPSGTRSQTPGTETDPESVHILSTTPSVSVTAITSGAFERERGDSDVSDVRRGGSEEDCGLERLGEGAPLPATWSKTNDSVSSVGKFIGYWFTLYYWLKALVDFDFKKFLYFQVPSENNFEVYLKFYV